MQSRNKNFKKSGNSGAAYLRLAHAKRSYAAKSVRFCPLESSPDSAIDYKNKALLAKFVSDYGRILPSRITFASAKKQRKLARAIKIARYMAILPYHGTL